MIGWFPRACNAKKLVEIEAPTTPSQSTPQYLGPNEDSPGVGRQLGEEYIQPLRQVTHDLIEWQP